jgi:glycosyltransferase involved in cell wall biosynthesis
MGRNDKKPVITLALDYPNWAFDYVARSIASRLSHRFKFKIHYGARYPEIRASETDLVYVFFWGYRISSSSGLKKEQVIKDVASFAWRHFNKDRSIHSKSQFVEEYLQDCICATTPSAELFHEITADFPNLIHCPNGVEFDYFSSCRTKIKKKQPLTIGWVGNPEDEFKVKGLHDILIPAAEGFRFEYTSGNMSRAELREFYSRIDVLAIGSSSETQPLPLLESMSAGCFPVATKVGIVPEVIRPGRNGLVVERSVDAFRDAFQHCAENLSQLRAARAAQKNYASSQTWDLLAERFGILFDAVLQSQTDKFVIPAVLKSPAIRIPEISDLELDKILKPNIVYSKMAAVKINFGDGIRRCILGNRFGQSQITPYYIRAIKSFRYLTAIWNRFCGIYEDSGIFQAIASAARSGLRQAFKRKA